MVHWFVLFGIPESDFHNNYRIIVTVQKYLLDSKRFEYGISLSFSHTRMRAQYI